MSAGQLSLYIDLEEGQKADLEAVARASLAYAAAIREIAAYIDPFSDIHVDLISTTEGSLSLNTRIGFRVAGRSFDTTIYALLIVFSGYLVAHVGDVLTDKALGLVFEKVFGEQTTAISEDDKNDIIKRAVDAWDARAGERQVKQFYVELNQDPAVSGVGICSKPGERPSHIVPRSEFPRRGGEEKLPDPPEKQRIRREIMSVILVSPVLENDRKRRWKFRQGDQEFGAPIRDQVFLDAVFSGKHPLIMKGNISMRVALEWQEDFLDGAWVAKKHVVWSVREVPGQYQGPQELLPFEDRPQTKRKPQRR